MSEKLSKNKWKQPGQIGLFMLFCLLLCIPVFYQLGNLPIQMWDESLFALRALHIFQHGEYLQNFNELEGLPDHRSTKLPFTTMLQVLGFEIFGVNEWGLRLPVAFIFLVTVFFTCYFTWKHIGSVYIGCLFGLIMVTFIGFVTVHMLRTGDQDVPFACYLFVGLLFFHRFIQTNKTGPLVGFSIAMIAAILTKNLLMGLLLPGLILFVIQQKVFLKLLKDYRVYLALIAIAGAYAATVGFLEYRYPGFLDRMWNYELLGRYSEPVDGHQANIFYYLEVVLWRGMMPYSPFLVFAIFLLRDKKMRQPIKSLITLLAITFGVYLIGISLSETKLSWYAAPLYPMAAMIVALGGYHLYEAYLRSLPKKARLGVLILTVSLVAFPYKLVMDSIIEMEEQPPDQRYGMFIEALDKAHPEIRDFTIIDDGFGAVAYFYRAKYNALEDESYQINYQREAILKKGEFVVVCLESVKDDLRKKYDVEVVHQNSGCELVKISGQVE